MNETLQERIETFDHKVKWQVSLSNGETFFEGKGRFKRDTDRSPWQQLIAYAADNKAFITSLSLFTDDGRTFNLPSLGKNPKFSPFDHSLKPFQFFLERNLAHDKLSDGSFAGGVEWFTVASALYKLASGDFIKLSLWVDEIDQRNTWTLVTMM